MYDELVKALRQHHCDAKEDDTQEVCEECSYDVIIVDKSAPSGFASVCVCGLMNRAADAIEELSVMLDIANDEATALYGALPRWIRVEEAQPTSQGPFFTRYGFGAASRETGQYFYGVRDYFFADPVPHWQDEFLGVEVTHWMPIPPMPEEGE